MAVGREGFNKVSSVTPTTPIPEFPKLPEALKRKLSAEDRATVEAYDHEVQEFFKKQATRSL